MAETEKSLKAKISAAWKKRDNYKKQASKLREAYEDLKALKDDQENLVSRIEKKVSGTADSGKWKGNHYNMFVQCGNAAKANAEEIYNNIDDIMDNINYEISCLEAKIDIVLGTINGLNHQLENLVR